MKQLWIHSISVGLSIILDKVQGLNREIDNKKPWELAKDADRHTELVMILEEMADELLQIAYLLKPFLPDVTEAISATFANEKILPPTTPLFPKDK